MLFVPDIFAIIGIWVLVRFAIAGLASKCGAEGPTFLRLECRNYKAELDEAALLTKATPLSKPAR